MAKRNLKKIRNKIQQFKQEAEKLGHKNAQYILFGSWAKGKQHAWSDIDICVISRKPIKNHFIESTKLRIAANKVDESIEPIIRNPSDLRDKYSALSQEISKWGIRV